MEALEDALLLARRDADAAIDHPHDDTRSRNDLTHHQDLAAIRAVLDRVLNQVEERAPQLIGIATDDRIVRRKAGPQAVAGGAGGPPSAGFRGRRGGGPA